MLFFWTFPTIFVILTVLYLLIDALARSRSSGPPQKTRWWLVFMGITFVSFGLAAIIEVGAMIILFAATAAIFT